MANANSFLQQLKEEKVEGEALERCNMSLKDMLQRMGLTYEDDLSKITPRQIERLIREMVDSGTPAEQLTRNIDTLKKLLEYANHPDRFKFNRRVKMAKLPPDVRVRGFDEIALGYTKEEVIAEANRCFTCRDPTCIDSCPAGVSIPAYIQAVAGGKIDVAYRILSATSPFNGVCGRACVHLCEDGCIHTRIGGDPVAISGIKRFVADNVDPSKSELKPKAPTGKHVAIVGSGPAGLTAAYHLALGGHSVAVFESSPILGGMLSVGIPRYRLPRSIVEREVDIVRRLGVEMKLNTRIEDLEELLQNGYDAVFIAAGAHVSMKLNTPGEDLEGVVHALQLLRDINMGREVKLTDKVIIIGGGDAAMDAARTAVRGVKREVSVYYRRSRKEMPAHAEQIEEAVEEGVIFKFLTAPTKIIGENGRVAALECIQMRLGEPDASGRRRPEPIPGSEFTVEVGNVIPAIGQQMDTSFLTPNCGVQVTKWSSIMIDEKTGATSRRGVFAGGDVVRGPATLVEAIADGKKVAKSIDNYLREVV